MKIQLLYDYCPFLYHEGIQLQDFIIRIIYSLLLGSSIGYMRQVKFRSAGLRTFSLLMMGSTLATLCSIYVPQIMGGGDSARIAAQIVSGVGFLGAGAILRGRGGSVQGLTTAALIWATATVGIAIGCGLYITSLIMTLLFVFVVDGLQVVKSKYHLDMEDLDISVTFDHTNPELDGLKTISEKSGLRVVYYTFETDFEQERSLVVLHAKVTDETDLHTLSQRIAQLQGVRIVRVGM